MLDSSRILLHNGDTSLTFASEEKSTTDMITTSAQSGHVLLITNDPLGILPISSDSRTIEGTSGRISRSKVSIGVSSGANSPSSTSQISSSSSDASCSLKARLELSLSFYLILWSIGAVHFTLL